MAKSKKFDSYDNGEKFESAKGQASDALDNLSGVIDSGIVSDIEGGVDEMAEAFSALSTAYDKMEADVEDLKYSGGEAERLQKEVDRLGHAVEVLSARLALAGLSTSTTRRQPRRRQADECDY